MKMKTKTLVIIIVVIALAIAVYMLRDKIFGKKKSDSDDSVEQKFADATAANDIISTYVAPAATSTTTTLQKGSRGDNVKKLQKALVDAGFSVGKSGVDGIFGDDTETALKKATGKTSITLDQLNEILPAKDSSVLQKGSQGENVKKLQKALVDTGFSLGKSGVDGIFGNDTETALKKATGKTSVTVEQLNKFLQAKDNGKTAAAAWQVALSLNPITAPIAGLLSVVNLFK